MTKIEEAIQFAVSAHDGSTRKGKNRPYILHPLDAMSIVAALTDDEDVIAAAVLHDVVEDTKLGEKVIREKFGDAVFNEDGTLNRRALGEIVFSSAPHRRALERIIHPLVQRTMLERMDQAAEAGARIVILDVPLLFETGMDALCDETWALYVGREMQISRIVARDGVTREQAEARIDSMMPTGERNARATCAVNTDQPVEKTRQVLAQLYRQAEKKA